MSIIPPRNASGARRDAILRDVADAIRNVDGDPTNIESVIAASNTRQQEVVAQFGSSSGLLIALMEKVARSTLEPLGYCRNEEEFRANLLEFAIRMTNEHSGLQLQRLYRIALTGVIRDASVGRDAYRHGPGLVKDELARFFRAAQSAGIDLSGDSHRLASHLMALLRARWSLVGVAPRNIVAASQQRDVNQIIELFCAGIQSEARSDYVVPQVA
ncbi:TetR/AcrR family transcriptional regulator C-terminal domain-containing protein [Lysobacter arenosi]|uniref:TetR/AcrR family transcriptional regulator C-terminal domain-containing protein n=1 Tax=Lysobacter arenosi TaxID=2795387 RepID=A0ABX7R9W7_9GAMM|nr:TetR/AcrR family transcriptional regulator C-terminal domain-containing protein [Lysobacter arenosi]QSX74192.1 TetR/AcrR family transcriptional regulator C-terminal domain-containing protein [Lysobacter arenosi]